MKDNDATFLREQLLDVAARLDTVIEDSSAITPTRAPSLSVLTDVRGRIASAAADVRALVDTHLPPQRRRVGARR